MGNLLDALNSLTWEGRMQEEISMSGFNCPYCLEKCEDHKGHSFCIKQMEEDMNSEFDNFCYEEVK